MKFYLISFGRILFLAYLLSLSLTPATGLTRKELLVVEEDFRDLAKAALPCTVSLLPGNSQIRSGMGSGIIVSPEGLILTAAHVALEMNEAVMVLFPDGKRLSGRVLGMDYARDSAMVQIEEQGPFPHVELGQSDDLEVNDWCIAMGHAGGYQPDRTPPVRLGRILNHRGNRFLTSDCALIGGDSGGPLFDRQGRLIGIHSNIGVSLSQNNHVPISAFLEKWNRLLAGERFGGNEPGSLLKDPDRPMIGAILGDLSNGSGSIIKRVIPDSPAEKAGLQKGDIIQRVQNQVVANTEELLQEIRKRKPGAKLSLRVRTGQITEEREITLAAAHRLQTWPQMGPNFNPTPSEPAPEPRKFSRKERAQLQEEFNQKMRDSIESGFLQFQPGELDRFGGREYLMDFLRAFERVASPKEREALMRMGQGEAPITPKTFDPSLPNPVKAGFFREVLDAFRPAVSEASQSTHLVFLGQEWKSLCTIVHEDGYALTKASEVNQRTNKGLNVLVEKGHLLPATIVKTLPRYDLALLKIEGSFPFVPVEWNSDRAPLPLGSLLAAAGPGPDARALGVVSVQPRALSGRNRGFLGISTAASPEGVRVTLIRNDGNAGKAGIRQGDIITKVNETPCETPEALIRVISGTPPGSIVVVHYLRDGRSQKASIRLTDRQHVDRSQPFRQDETNRFGTEISQRSFDYPSALQHDLPINPEECGGPLVDLLGRVVGINIARAGRMKTYALPSHELATITRQLLAEKGAFSAP